MARADRFTVERAKPVIYSDFDINMTKNPLTGRLVRLTNEDSVRNRIRNLVLTGRRERPNQPLLGSKAASLLFDEVDEITAAALQETITESIRTDPAVDKLTVNVIPDPNNNSYRLDVVFSIVNIPEMFSFSQLLKRAR